MHVPLQVQNLRKQNDMVAKFVMGQKLARIAAELLGVNKGYLTALHA